MLWWCFSDNINPFDLFVQSINPSSTTIVGLPLNAGQQFVTILSFLFTSLLITGLLISTLVNWLDRRHDKWAKGDVSYNIDKNFVLIIGGHGMVASLCEQILNRDKLDFIVIQTRRVAISLRKEIESRISPKDYQKIIIYNGDRCSESDLSVLNAESANEIYLIGENKKLDGYDHDTRNLQCFHYLSNILDGQERGANGRKTPCHVMFSYQSSFHVFQYTDVSKGSKNIDFIPFNIFRVTAQQVLVNNELGEQKYTPLDGDKGIGENSEKFVHLIIVGMSRMGSAMAVEAAHLCHFPNFIMQKSHPRTLITFIDRNGKREMTYFKGRYNNMFELARSRYVNMDNNDTGHRPYTIYDSRRDSFVDPLKDGSSIFDGKTLGNNFIDIDWEFIDGDVASPLVQQYLIEAAKDDNAITTIALCLPVTVESISAALYMPEAVYRSDNILQILVEQTTNDSIVSALRHSINGGDKRFTKMRPFGVFSECNYLKLASNKLPQIVAYTYSKVKPQSKENLLAPLFKDGKLCYEKAEEAWNNISSRNGKSVIAQKISNYCFAEMIGVKQRSFGVKSGDEVLTDTDLIKLMAKVEHNRWNIEQLLIGYRPVMKSDATLLDEMSEDDYRTYQKSRRVHPDLIAYDKLKESSYAYDERLSAHLPILLKIMEQLKES
jgi:hypothetical protein